MNQQRTTVVSLAPWIVLLSTAIIGAVAKYLNADASVLQLLSTIAGICGGAILPRRNDAPTSTTVTASDPPTVTTAPA